MIVNLLKNISYTSINNTMKHNKTTITEKLFDETVYCNMSLNNTTRVYT